MTHPPYPTGIVTGPCICGSWPGGECLRCQRIEHHYYAFYLKPGEPIPFYDRTFPDLNNAMRWVKEQKRLAFFTIDCLPKDYWY